MSSMKYKNKVKNTVFPLSDIKKFKIKKKEKIYLNVNISICIHCYDIKIFKELMFYIKNFFEFNWNNIQIIIHYIGYSQKEIEDIIELSFKDLKEINKLIKITDSFIFIKGENIGVDIGGFLKCLEKVKNEDDIIIKIHTKSDDLWRRSMMNIFSIDGIYTSIKLLEFKNIGMIGSLYNIEHFRKKYNPQFNINQYYIPMIQNICNQINFPFNDKNLIESYFVAGTIFICKRNLLNDIIKERNYLYNLCLDLRKSKWKSGKMKYTYEHALEIMFGYIPFQKKQYLIGLY